MSTLKQRAAEFRAKAAQIRSSLGEVAEVIYLRKPDVRATLEQAEAEVSATREAKAAARELKLAKQCGPELAHVVDLRQRGREFEADIYERAQVHRVREQRAAFEQLNATDDEPEERETALLPATDPEPPTAA